MLPGLPAALSERRGPVACVCVCVRMRAYACMHVGMHWAAGIELSDPLNHWGGGGVTRCFHSPPGPTQTPKSAATPSPPRAFHTHIVTYTHGSPVLLLQQHPRDPDGGEVPPIDVLAEERPLRRYLRWAQRTQTRTLFSRIANRNDCESGAEPINGASPEPPLLALAAGPQRNQAKPNVRGEILNRECCALIPNLTTNSFQIRRRRLRFRPPPEPPEPPKWPSARIDRATESRKG